MEVKSNNNNNPSLTYNKSTFECKKTVKIMLHNIITKMIINH